MDEARRRRRLTLLGLLALEMLLFSGPFLLGWLYVEWHAWRGLPAPRRIPFMAPMLGAGLALALGWIGWDGWRWLRHRRQRKP